MSKLKELGIVKKVHSSGIVETDKGFRSNFEAKLGDRLVQNINTRVVSIAAKKTRETAEQKAAKEKAEQEAAKEKAEQEAAKEKAGEE